VLYVLDSAQFHSSRKLILELLTPKVNELLQTWKNYNEERSLAVSADMFIRAIGASITGLLLVPHFANIPLPQIHSLEADLKGLTIELLSFLRELEAKDSRASQALFEMLLQAIHPFLPVCGSHEFKQLIEKSRHLFDFFVLITKEINHRESQFESLPLSANDDMMDIDDEFSAQQNQNRTDRQTIALPRRDFALDMSSGSFICMTRERLMLIAAIDSPRFVGYISSTFIDKLISMPNEELLSCRRLLREILNSDLILDGTDAARLVEHVGSMLQSNDWARCEPVHGLCLDVLVSLGSLWSQQDGSDTTENATQLYDWFIQTALRNDIISPAVQKGIAKLLLLLVKIDQDNVVSSSFDPQLPSPRSSLFTILRKGSISVKFYVGNRLPNIFEAYQLTDHDLVIVDILNNLPNDPDDVEGIAFRLFVLAQLASKWPSLLRRCIYHIFETPGKIPDSVRHATRCLANVSSALKTNGPQELFTLFAPQLLYTWLDDLDLDHIPFQIFGFATLKDLVLDVKQEVVSLMMMRGQEAAIESLAQLLQVTVVDLVQSCFTKVIAYTISYDISIPPKNAKRISGESRVKKCLRPELFFECFNVHFADMIALFFDLIDQEGDLEKYLVKQEAWKYAANSMIEIKSTNSSKIVLPPNQQPTFRIKYLTQWISYVSSKTEFGNGDLYTPALVTFIARKLLDTIDPALGSLHACSVLRKLRVLISLSGKVAVQGYPLEMLLQSVSYFIADAVCAADAFGIIQYLLVHGSAHIKFSPSFLAGIALSIFGALRVFLQSSQASSTQESHHEETMSKAKQFHTWMGKYVAEYDSPGLNRQSKANFHALVQSASDIGLGGNANIGTPESDLLLRLLEDEQDDKRLLSRPSRELALKMLCSEFQCPESYRIDILGTDELAMANATLVSKSCRGQLTSKQYLSWAGRVLGRAFTASGHVNQELLRESNLSQIKQFPLHSELEEEGRDSRPFVLGLMQTLILSQERRTAGLAEAALRVIVSKADESLAETCRKVLSTALNEASIWSPYHVPPSEETVDINHIGTLSDSFASDAIMRPLWLRNLSIRLTRFVPHDAVLSALEPILRGVEGFAEQAFPFILHLVLSTPSQSQSLARKQLSGAFALWFSNCKATERNSLKMLINSILYLRTRPLPQERSSADRSNWLDIDYLNAAVAATRCGMFKTALLFVEEFCAGPSPAKSSRRSLAIYQDSAELPTEILLTIFENIDDPDLYYGVKQNASLSTILGRLEYEKDGSKSLAFRGAQYDSHVRSGDPGSTQDAESLTKALDVLSLSGLSHSLLQAQPTVDMSSTSLESMFRTARKLEQWDIPVPSNCNNNAITLYKAFQAVQRAPDHIAILSAINEGFDSTMSSLIREDLGASALHSSLQTLSALVEMDEVLSTRGSVQFEELLSRFRSRSRWMRTGR